MLFRKKVLLAKIETTYGVDATPTGVANAIETRNLQIKNFEGNKIQTNIDRPILGNDEQINVGPHTTLSFEVLLAAAGAAGTAPAYGPLLRACGFAETINAGTDVQYAPVSSGYESVTMCVHIDGQLHKVTGARGTVSFDLTSGGLPVMQFNFTGLHIKPATGAIPASDFTAFKKALPVTKANTQTYTVHGYAAVAQSLSVNMANEVNYHNVVNSESVRIVDRAPSGSITIEAPSLDSKDFYQTVEDRTQGSVNIVHGTTDGAIVELNLPQVQLLNPDLTEDNGIGMLKMEANILPTTDGDDELELIIR